MGPKTRYVPCFLQSCISFLILWKEKRTRNTLLRCLHKQVQVWEHRFHGFSLQLSSKITPSQLLLCTCGKLAKPLLSACEAQKGQSWSKEAFYHEEENRYGREINGRWGAECMLAGVSVPMNVCQLALIQRWSNLHADHLHTIQEILVLVGKHEWLP